MKTAFFSLKSQLFWLFILFNYMAYSQNQQEQEHVHHAGCGVDYKFIQTLQEAPPKTPNLFPPGARMVCGKFELYFADLLPGAPAVGFAETAGGLGLIRRNTLCAVLNYVQSVYNFNNIPSNAPIRIRVDASLAPTVNPAAITDRFLANGGPTVANTPNQINGGRVYDYTTTGIDPAAPLQYHGRMLVNFDATAGFPINWHSDHTQPIGNCQYDLFSVLLHEVGHILGFISYANNNGAISPASLLGGNQFSRLDFQLFRGTVGSPTGLQKMILGTTTSPSFNPALTAVSLTDNRFWVNGNAAPNNHPMYSGQIDLINSQNFIAGSVLSHLDEQLLSYTMRSRNSPGYAENYVMGPFGIIGALRRTFTDAEIRIFLAMGYTLNPGYSNPQLNNLPPYSQKVANYANYANNDFAETVPNDFPNLTNNIGTTFTIDLWADATVSDPEGLPVTVAAGTLTNIRGCGNGGNNHNQLTVSANGRFITYTPRANFFGRVQFAFRLFDGQKVGSWHVYTFQVVAGTNVSFPAGSNLILNGTLEEGSEVKLTADVNKHITAVDLNFMREGFMRGNHLSDAQPFNHFSNFWSPVAAGNMIRESFSTCNQNPSSFGSSTTSFPHVNIFNPFTNPDSGPNGGDRYMQIFDSYNYFTLGASVQSCKRYILKFDYMNRQNLFNDGQANYPLTFGFTTTPTFPALATLNHSFQRNLPVIAPNTWQHIEYAFTYCGTLPSNFLNIRGFNFPGLMIDNLELVEVTTPAPALLVNIPNNSPICLGSSMVLTANVTNGLCNVSYLWSTGQTSQSITVTPSTTTSYSVTVFDGCRSTTQTVTVGVTKPPQMPSMLNLITCEGTLVGASNFTSTPAGATYTWTNNNPSIGLAASGTGNTPAFTAQNPFITPITGTITVTPSIGSCSGSPVSYTITVNPQPAMTAPANIVVCKGATVAASNFTSVPAGAVFYWSNSNTNIGLGGSGTGNVPGFVATNNTSSPITATITVIPKVGHCLGNAVTYTITVNPAPILTVTPSNTTIVAGGNVNLVASGGTSYTWTPATGLSCTTCPNPTASPTANTVYTVSSTNAYGCTGTATAIVNIAGTACTNCPNVLAPGGVLSSSPTSGLVYCVNNNIVVTGNANIHNSELKIAANVQIIVQPGVTLTISGSHLYTCGAMWQGIKVMPGGKVATNDAIVNWSYLKSTLIEDAVTAIEIVGGSTLTSGVLTVTNTVFNRNHTGIRISDYTQQVTPYPFTITNSVFTCRNLPFTSNTINWPQTAAVLASNTPTTLYENQVIDNGDFLQTGSGGFLKAPYASNTKSAIGLDLINVGVTNNASSTSPTYYELSIGGASNRNTFDNVLIGVNLLNSNFKSVNNLYQNTGIKGIGINARAEVTKNNRLQVLSVNTTTEINNFIDCGMAIKSSNYFEHNIQYCDVRSPQVNGNSSTARNGFNIQTNRYRICNILRNNMYNISNGIMFNAINGQYNVTGNLVTGQYAGLVNVDYNIIRPNITGSGTTRFVDNAIVLQNSGSVSQFANNITPVISTNSNTITAHKSIFYLNWRKQNVQSQNNTITIASSPYLFSGAPFYGIVANNCWEGSNGGNFIRSNNVTGYYTPVLGSDPIYDGNQKGIAVALSGQFMVRCNVTTNTVRGIEFAGGNPSTSVRNNTMTNHRYGFVLDQSGEIGEQGTATVYPDNVWGGTWLSDHYKTGVLGGSTAVFSKMHVRHVAAYNPEGSGYSSTPVSTATRYSVAAGTLEVHVNSAIPFLPCIQVIPWPHHLKMMEDITQDVTVYNNPNMSYINKNNIFRTISEDSVIRDSSVVLDNFYNASLSTNLNSFYQVEEKISQGLLFDASLANGVILTTNGVDRNYQEFYQCHLAYLQGLFKPADNAILLAVAQRCPFEFGNAVYQARALYNIINETFISFTDACETEVPLRKSLDEQKGSEILIYPNPAKSEVNISTTLKDDSKLKILVTDLNGKVVYQNDALEVTSFVSKFTLDVNNGVYLVHVTDPSNHETSIKKLLIQK